MKPSPSRLLRRLFFLWLPAVLLLGVFIFAAKNALNTPDLPPLPQAAPAAPLAPQAAKNATVPPFDPQAEYVLTAVPMRGVITTDDGLPAVSLLPPKGKIAAQLIRRGPTPEPVTAGVRITYTLPEEMLPLRGRPLSPANGDFDTADDDMSFESPDFSVSPYSKGFSFTPYPVVKVEARDAEGILLASTKTVLPVSTEVSCRNCHGGPWGSEAGTGGISDRTAMDILKTHDKRNRTDLAKAAASGSAAECRNCHGKKPELPSLSAAVHGFHAAMRLTNKSEGQDASTACASCHPSQDPGSTMFFRDTHKMWGLNCTRCHGTLEEHASALLTAEKNAGHKGAAARLATLPADAQRAAAKAPRLPYVNMPQCAGCHDFKEKPDPMSASAFGKWTQTKAERFSFALENTGKLRCLSCHGAPHALYPSTNPVGDDRDNLQPLQYQKEAAPLGMNGNCGVCHIDGMDYFIHHDKVGQ